MGESTNDVHRIDYDPWPRIKVNTFRQEGKVIQDIDYLGQLTRRVIDVATKQWDEAVRAELIAQGWTPPPGDMP